MSVQTSGSVLPPRVLPIVTTLPIDGYGGSYYDVQFSIPVYSHGVFTVYRTTSWSDIDRYYNHNVSNALESAVSFGICATTLLNLVALTPQHKRRLPLHSFICLALILQVIRNAADMVLMTRGLWVASYIYITLDLGATTVSKWFYAVSALGEVSACLAFVFVQACFFIQARALMAWLRIYHEKLFHVLLTLLVVAGAIAIGFRIGLAVVQVMHLDTNIQHKSDNFLQHGTLIAYGISIGCWSMVFFASAASIILTRRRKLFNGNNVYDVALTLVAVLGIQSFVVPILLCILQLLPIHLTVNKPEQLIIPSVLFLLPIGTLFATTHSNDALWSAQIPQKSSSLEHSVINRFVKQDQEPSQTRASENDANPNRSGFNNVAVLPTKGNEIIKFPDPVETELALIDGINEHEPQRGINR